MNKCLSCNSEVANKYCNGSCQKRHEHGIFIERWKLGLEKGMKGYQTSSHIHRYLKEKFNGVCQVCKNDSWMGKPIPLELEHIDGNSENNKEDNLNLLCANCHSQTPTYKAKNKGHGRPKRMEKYYHDKNIK